MTWEHISQIRLPFGGHLLKRFPDEGYADEKQYYYPWAAASEQDVLYQMGRLESRSKSEEQLTLAIYRCYKEEYEKLCLEDGRLEQILSLQEFFKWLQTQPDGFFAEVELKERGIAGAVIQMAEKYHVEERCIIFSGIEDVIWEIQDWCKNHGKPDRLRLGKENAAFFRIARFLCGFYAGVPVHVFADAFVDCRILVDQIIVVLIVGIIVFKGSLIKPDGELQGISGSRKTVGGDGGTEGPGQNSRFFSL